MANSKKRSIEQSTGIVAMKTSTKKKAKMKSSKKEDSSTALNPSAPSFHMPARLYAGNHSEPIDVANGYHFYQSGTGSGSVPPVQQTLSRLFDQYRDQPKTEPDKIGIEGAQSYLTDLSVDLDEVAHLALCELLQCPSIGEFEREPFITGWRSLTSIHSSSPGQPYDSIARQAAHINTMRKRLVTDPSYFKQVYRNAFKLAKPENQKSVPMESAIEFWNMFFRQGKGGIEWNSSSTKWLDMWLKFYEKNSGRPVNKDLWNMVGELVTKTKEPGGESLDWWTEDGAWPMAIDDFVTSVKEKNSTVIENMDVS